MLTALLAAALTVGPAPTVRPIMSYAAVGITSDLGAALTPSALLAPTLAAASVSLAPTPALALAPTPLAAAPAAAVVPAPAEALRSAAEPSRPGEASFDGVRQLAEANLPDPAIVKAGRAWYLTGTSNRAADAFPLLKSSDMKTWAPAGHIFPAGKRPAWTPEGGYFWAPEIHRVAGRWVVYYTAEDKAGKLALGAAWAKSPEGPWTDLGRPMLDDPRVGLIDSHFFRDTDGRQYLYYKEDSNGLSPKERTGIFARELTADGLEFVGEAKRLLENDLAWEGDLIEGPWVVKRGKWYHLIYSANSFADGRYAVGAARSLSPMGPFIKKGAPVLSTSDERIGPGHGMVLKRSRRYHYVHHAWKPGEVGGSDLFMAGFLPPYPPGQFPRVPLIERMRWRENWPVFGAP